MTDTMLLAGAKKLASLSPALQTNTNEDNLSDYEYKGESLMPDFGDAPKVNFEIGVAVAEQAIKEGSATVDWANGLAKQSDEVIERIVRDRAAEKLWVPVYYEYDFDENGLEDV